MSEDAKADFVWYSSTTTLENEIKDFVGTGSLTGKNVPLCKKNAEFHDIMLFKPVVLTRMD